MQEHADTTRVRSAVTAGVAARCFARASDALIVLVIAVVGSLVPGAAETPTATAVNCALVAVAVVIAEALMVARWGRTPGKALFGLTVVTTDGGRVPFVRALVRAAMIWVTTILGGFVLGTAGPEVLVGGFACLAGPMLARRDHRGLHDIVTGTDVVTDR